MAKSRKPVSGPPDIPAVETTEQRLLRVRSRANRVMRRVSGWEHEKLAYYYTRALVTALELHRMCRDYAQAAEALLRSDEQVGRKLAENSEATREIMARWMHESAKGHWVRVRSGEQAKGVPRKSRYAGEFDGWKKAATSELLLHPYANVGDLVDAIRHNAPATEAADRYLREWVRQNRVSIDEWVTKLREKLREKERTKHGMRL